MPVVQEAESKGQSRTQSGGESGGIVETARHGELSKGRKDMKELEYSVNRLPHAGSPKAEGHSRDVSAHNITVLQVMCPVKKSEMSPYGRTTGR